MKKIHLTFTLLVFCFSFAFANNLLKLIPAKSSVVAKININQLISKSGKSKDDLVNSFTNDENKKSIIKNIQQSLNFDDGIYIYHYNDKTIGIASFKNTKFLDKYTKINTKINKYNGFKYIKADNIFLIWSKKNIALTNASKCKIEDYKNIFDKKKSNKTLKKLDKKNDDIWMYANYKALMNKTLGNAIAKMNNPQLTKNLEIIKDIIVTTNFKNGKVVVDAKTSYNNKADLKKYQKVVNKGVVSKKMFKYFDYANSMCLFSSNINFKELEKTIKENTKDIPKAVKAFAGFDEFLKRNLNNYKIYDLLNGEIVGSINNIGMMGIEFKLVVKTKSVKKVKKVLKSNTKFVKKYDDAWALGRYENDTFFPKIWLKFDGDILVFAKTKNALFANYSYNLPEEYKNIIKSKAYLAVNLKSVIGAFAMFNPELASNKNLRLANNFIVRGNVNTGSLEISTTNKNENFLKTIANVLDDLNTKEKK